MDGTPAVPGGRPRTPSKKIAAELRAAIGRGDYDARPKLPSAVSLAELHGVSVATARKALLALVAEGLAEAVPGMGTFASPGAAGRTPAPPVLEVAPESVARQREASARQVGTPAAGDRAPIDPRGYDLVYEVVAAPARRRPPRARPARQQRANPQASQHSPSQWSQAEVRTGPPEKRTSRYVKVHTGKRTSGGRRGLAAGGARQRRRAAARPGGRPGAGAGRTFEIPVCFIYHVNPDGQIDKVNEYAATPAFLGAS